jgi:AraC-like DNA-binding protein
MRERYDEPLSLAELAAAAFLSPFHFARTFRRVAGVSPGRYLAAIRFYEAKRLLLTTDQTVADISCRVGYSSVGTFTTRFTRYVGVSPNRYRQMPPDSVLALDADYRRLPQVSEEWIGTPHGVHGATLFGTVEMPVEAVAERIMLGVFAGPIAQGCPVACTLLEGRPSSWTIESVPLGEWLLLGLATLTPASGHLLGTPILVSGTQLSIRPDQTGFATCSLRPPLPTDPPILLTVGRPSAVA